MNPINYLKMKDHKGPSGVPLGGIGTGYFSIDPSGYVNRLNVNNIHKDFFPKGQKGFFAAVWQGGEQPKAARVQRDTECKMGLRGFDHTEYTGLYPFCTLKAENETPFFDFNVSLNAYSYLIPHNAKDSSLPAAWVEVVLENTADKSIEAAAALSWGDVIYRGMKDFEAPISSGNFSGDNKPFIQPIDTVATSVTVDAGINQYKGIKQYATETYAPVKWTFQNYNREFLILAEEVEDGEISVCLAYDVTKDIFPESFTQNGCFADGNADSIMELSKGGNPDQVVAASAVAVKSKLAAKETKVFRFLVVWFMPQPDMEAVQKGPEGSFFPNCDYGKYYHNWFNKAEAIAAYASAIREEAVFGSQEWQVPIMMSTMPDWLKFKQINTAYTLYTNTVFTKEGLFSTLEGEMGGLGGTQDQKMSSHPVYQKFFTELDNQENMQYYNTIGEEGDILHFDVHYYHGIANSDPAKKESPTPFGSMMDNGGSWIIQLAKTYEQTGDIALLQNTYDGVTRCMAFIESKVPENGLHIPIYNTTYDDAKHPPVLIYAGTIYLAILKGAIRIAKAMKDADAIALYETQLAKTLESVEKLYVTDEAGVGYYCFGSDADGSNMRDEVIFAGHLAGQFMSRYCGWGDVLPLDHVNSSLYKHFTTSIQEANDYYAAKIWDWKRKISLDQEGSRCWPFYLESYSAMTGIQAGCVEDGLKIMEHIQKVHYNLGYSWTLNLWNPAEATYMTAPVTWFVNDVLAGAAVDVNEKVLTLGPVTLDEDTPLVTPLYYPEFWAVLQYDPKAGACSYEIIKTYGDKVHEIDTLRVMPNAKPSAEACDYKLAETFQIQEGAVLDLSDYCQYFNFSEKVPSVLRPVAPYDGTYSTAIDTGEDLYMKD